jgi:ubiquitin carboxyl-terminal hydrolase 34
MKQWRKRYVNLSLDTLVSNIKVQIYYFLVQFPIYDRILGDIDSDTRSYSEIFPRGQPFKSLYAVHALRQHIVGQSQKVNEPRIPLLGGITNMCKGAVDKTTLARAVSLIVAAMSDPDVLRDCASELRDCLALHLIDCFVQLLKGIVTFNVSCTLSNVLQSRCYPQQFHLFSTKFF